VSEWWFNNSGQNLLSGIPDDEANPPKLSDSMIQQHLRRIPAARESFERLLPTMLPEEQERLNGLARFAFANVFRDESLDNAERQARENQRIITSGPKGGGPFHG